MGNFSINHKGAKCTPNTTKERKNQILGQLRSYYGTIVDDYLSYEECSWSEEAFTFFPYQNFILPHQNNGHAVFRQELFDNRLIIAGSETAKSFPGYMDGAVQSAHRAVEQVQKRFRKEGALPQG